MINLKYSKDVVKDYDQLTDGRKNYIIKRAEKKGVCVSDYLLEKYERARPWFVLDRECELAAAHPIRPSKSMKEPLNDI
jgi:hypothetical protein